MGNWGIESPPWVEIFVYGVGGRARVTAEKKIHLLGEFFPPSPLGGGSGGNGSDPHGDGDGQDGEEGEDEEEEDEVEVLCWRRDTYIK